jgi:hypothetical protein
MALAVRGRAWPRSHHRSPPSRRASPVLVGVAAVNQEQIRAPCLPFPPGRYSAGRRCQGGSLGGSAGGAGRLVEQHTRQRALGLPQRQPPRQSQQPHRVPGGAWLPHRAGLRAPVPRLGRARQRSRKCPPTAVGGPRRGICGWRRRVPAARTAREGARRRSHTDRGAPPRREPRGAPPPRGPRRRALFTGPPASASRRATGQSPPRWRSRARTGPA